MRAEYVKMHRKVANKQTETENQLPKLNAIGKSFSSKTEPSMGTKPIFCFHFCCLFCFSWLLYIWITIFYCFKAVLQFIEVNSARVDYERDWKTSEKMSASYRVQCINYRPIQQVQCSHRFIFIFITTQTHKNCKQIKIIPSWNLFGEPMKSCLSTQCSFHE